MRPASVALTSGVSPSAASSQRFKLSDSLRAGMRAFGAGGIGFDALGAQFFEFLQADFFKRCVFWHSSLFPLLPSSSSGRGTG